MMSSLSLSDFELRRVPKNRAQDEAWVSQHYALFVTDVLRGNLPSVLYVLFMHPRRREGQES